MLLVKSRTILYILQHNETSVLFHILRFLHFSSDMNQPDKNDRQTVEHDNFL
jgi:hypothetical protein